MAEDKFGLFDMEGNLMASSDTELGDFDAGSVPCSHSGCKNRAPDHRWSDNTVAGKGWFHKKDGSEHWCPEHLPEWVGPWRAKQAAAKKEKRK